MGKQRSFVSDVAPSADNVGFDPTLRVLSEGVVLPVRNAVVVAYRNTKETVRLGNARLAEAQILTGRANGPTIAYREALIGAMPRTVGMRFAARLKDLEDRINAGDRSTTQGIAALVDESEQLRHEPTVGVKLRRHFIRRVKQLAKHQHEVARRLKRMPRKLISIEPDKVGPKGSEVATIVASLRGR